MNNTTGTFQELNIKKEKLRILRIVIFTVIAVATFLGNTLILVTLRRFAKELKGTPYILIGNLAVADLLLAIGLTLQLIEFISTSLEANRYFCLVKICVLAVSLTTSGKLLLFMSVDRFFAIVCPMRHLAHTAKRRRRTIKVTLIWVISLLVGCIPTIVHARLSQGNSECRFGELIPRAISLLAAVFIPVQFIISVVLCLIVIWRLRTNSMCMHNYKKSLIKCRLLIKVYMVFAICWAPFVVTTYLIETTSQKEKLMAVRKYTVMPGFLNSAMNWIIYGLANKKLRSAFKDVLLCRNYRERYKENYILSAKFGRKERKTGSEMQPAQAFTTVETSILA